MVPPAGVERCLSTRRSEALQGRLRSIQSALRGRQRGAPRSFFSWTICDQPSRATLHSLRRSSARASTASGTGRPSGGGRPARSRGRPSSSEPWPSRTSGHGWWARTSACAGFATVKPATGHPARRRRDPRARPPLDAVRAARALGRGPRPPSAGRRRWTTSAGRLRRGPPLHTRHGQLRARATLYERAGWRRVGNAFEPELGLWVAEYRRDLG